MIRSLVVAAVLLSLPARAEEEAPAPEAATQEEQPDTSIDRWRTPVEALTERMIGTASKPVRFDWRNSTIGFGVVGSELLERNNFGSARLGGFVRKAFGSFMGEVAITRAFTWDTDSSRKLALTPYRQSGRPSRLELDVNVAYPVAEGVMTVMPGFMPPAELVFSVNGGLRYLFYPGSQGRARFADVAKALVAPQLTDWELRKMEDMRLGGMQIDRARYGLMGGVSLDVFFQPGAFVSPRGMVAIPLLGPATGSSLGLWWELSLAMGWML